MENKKEKVLDNFLNIEEDQIEKIKDIKKDVLRERTGLIERVDCDKILIDKKGRQLLREQY